MKPFFDYIQKFPFKNIFALLVTYKMFDMLVDDPSLRDLLIVLITLIIKHFFDSNTGSNKKDDTISTLANNQSNPVVTNSEVTNVNTEKK